VKRLPATRVYYGLSFLLSMLAWVIVAVYFVRDVHMSPLQLVLVGSVMEAAIFAFEIPTGALADTYGRRRSVIVSFVVQGGATILLGSVPSFPVIAAAWALWGFGYTFQSGAYEAWITDEVGADAVGPVFMRATRLRYAGGTIGLVAGVGIALWSLQAAVIAGGALEVACGIACIFVMPETGFVRRPRTPRRQALRELAATAGAGARFVRVQPLLLLILGITLLAGASSEAFDRLWEAHFIRDVGLPTIWSLDPVVWFGLFGIGVSLVGLLASTFLIRRFEGVAAPALAKALLLATAVLMGAQIGFGLSRGLVLAVCALFVGQLARSLAYPVYMTWLNQQIDDSTVRATVISITGQADAVGQTAGGPALGAVGNVWGIRAALVAGALLLAPALGLYGRAIGRGGAAPLVDEVAAAPVPAA
jgi:DHA3 family tetracycline resistance protein-like MFS transporter